MTLWNLYDTDENLVTWRMASEVAKEWSLDDAERDELCPGSNGTGAIRGPHGSPRILTDPLHVDGWSPSHSETSL